ncbi:DinB family protein [Bacillus cereus]|uniref:DinB family protein n=1 Tax=Bacillus cereus TaxID=1396 RepID=UPI000BF6DC44|nr:DinB family protein [Bacillus cereus]PFJ83806.1 damage-inducible protein DinB [Bacillus cereus]
MLKLFQYNWQVRDDWFILCEDIPDEELLKKRVGGFGSILHTLFHIVDVEYMWILGLRGEPVPKEPLFEDYASLQKLKNLSAQYHEKVKPFVTSWTNEMDSRKLSETDFNEEPISSRDAPIRRRVIECTHGEIIRHVIVHEIHHIGQLSIWAREIGKEPVSANLRERGLFDN